MRQAWRWYGPDDPVTLDHVRQAGATEIVSAPHQYVPGEVWPQQAVADHKAIIENASR
jgi:mannonate dehydratase